MRRSRAAEDIVWNQDGIPYLRPEIQLPHEAVDLRPKVQADFDAVLPVLGSQDRRRLRNAIKLTHPGHRCLLER